jgi:hypothetical protein
MAQAERPLDEAGPAHPAYAQPTPRLLYVHDDLSSDVIRRFGADSAAADLLHALFALLSRSGDRVVILTVAEQINLVISRGPHAPFDLALGISRAGERVAQALHLQTGWFPHVRRLGLTREEDGRGDYRLVSTVAAPLAAQLDGIDGIEGTGSLAVVDDTVFSGLTMRSVLEALPPTLLPRTHAFCLRGIGESIAAVARLCPVTAGVAAPGRMLEDVSFINASGLVLRVGIRRHGQAPLAFFDRPDWIRAWFPDRDGEVIGLCRRLNALLEAED